MEKTMMFPKGKKGITPIIAIILLLMMTVAVAGAAFFWLSRIQNQLQGGVESFQGTMMTQVASKLDVVGADYDNNTAHLTLFFQNTGNTKIPVANVSTFPTTAWILRDSNQVARCSSTWNGTATTCLDGCGNYQINVGEVHKVVLALSSPCTIYSNETGTLFSFTADFSGKTTSSGTFIPTF
jgi:flagellin-like protein